MIEVLVGAAVVIALGAVVLLCALICATLMGKCWQ